MGDHGVRDHVRRVSVARRPDGGPAWTAAHLPRRPRALHARVAGLWPGVERRRVDRVTRGSGRRRGDHLAGRALDRHHDVQRGRGAEQGARDLGCARRLGRGRRCALRRDPDEVSGLGMDLLRERARGRAGVRVDAPDRSREPRGPWSSAVRCDWSRERHRRSGAARVRDLESARRRLGDDPDDRLPARRRPDPRLLRRLGAARERTARPLRDLSDPHADRRKQRRVAARRHDLRELLHSHVVRPADTRLVGAQDRVDVPRDGGHDGHLGGCRAGSRDQDRCSLP